MSYIDCFRGLRWSGIMWHRNKQVLKEGDILQDKGYCGVVYIRNIKWNSSKEPTEMQSGIVDVYVAPFTETDRISVSMDKPETTHHRVMMEDLQLWGQFEKLLAVARDEGGRYRSDFRLEKEEELFYGFTRKFNQWYCTSCTLNTWIDRPGGKDHSEVVRKVGEKKTDETIFKADLINEMPGDLWTKLLPKLHVLTPNDDTNFTPWEYSWAESHYYERSFQQEQLKRMRSLVCRDGRGSDLFWLSLDFKRLGDNGISAVQALASVLQEQVKRRNRVEDRCVHLQKLNLSNNDLTDEHIGVLAPVFAKCLDLQELLLSNNEIGDAGCKLLCDNLHSDIIAVDLSHNQIGDNGSETLRTSLPSSITRLDLSENNIGKEECDKAARCKTKVQQSLCIMNCNPGSMQAEEHDRCLQGCRCL